MNFTKVVNPCICDAWTSTGREIKVLGYCEINYKNGNLSIHGVVGPRKGGNCYGSCGQCVDSIRDGKPADDWTEEMLTKFCDIWDEWHLNDMKSYCRHMKKLGWDKEASEKVKIYHYVLNSESLNKQKAAEKDAVDHMKEGKTFTPSDEQVFYSNLSYFLDMYGSPLEGKLEKYYEPSNGIIRHAVEERTRGWIDYNKSELGLIGKPCPECGFKYGTAWLKEEVPEDVIQWLYNLPDAKKQPEWV